MKIILDDGMFFEAERLEKEGLVILRDENGKYVTRGNRNIKINGENIKPLLAGDIATAPRSQAYFMVTEYGCVNLVGRSTWERAEMLISLAHPDYRDELIKAAQDQGIWRRSNR